jgi:hypothetical protein
MSAGPKPVSYVRMCTEILHLQLTVPQRVLAAVTIDGVQPRDLGGEEREAARVLFDVLDEIDPRLRRILVWRLARASGKTTMGAALLIYCAWLFALPAGGHGHVPVAFIVSATHKLAKILQGVARELVRGSDLERYVVGDTADGFLLRRPDGRIVEIASVAASKGGANLRGRDVVILVVDESEFLGSEEAAVSDRDQVAAVMPRLLGYVLLISTIWPTENLTAELFERNFGHPVDAVAAMGESMFMRPSEQLAQDIARETARDPENADREYRNRSTATGGSKVFDKDSVNDSLVEGRPLVVHAPEGAVVGFAADLAFERDSTTGAAVSQLDGNFELLEFDEIRPAKDAPTSPSYAVRQRLTPLVRRHGGSSIMADSHYRQTAIEHFDADGIEFQRAPEGAQGKFDVYMFVRGLLRERKLRLPDVPRLVSQLCAVTSTPLAGGLVRISSPRRAGQGHGDIVSALVLACWAAREGSSEPEWIRAMSALRAGGAPSGPPIKVRTLPNGSFEAVGQPPKFSTAEAARFHFHGPATFSHEAKPEFAAELAAYRSKFQI